MAYFGYGEEVASLVVSVFVAGYVVGEWAVQHPCTSPQLAVILSGPDLGPLLWGPLSEHIGRRPVFILSFTFYLVCVSFSLAGRTEIMTII